MTTTQKVVRRIGTFAMMGAALAALHVARPATAAAEEILIGVVNALTGLGNDLGISGQQGADLAVEQINKAGGVNGDPIKLIYRDDESNPQKAVAGALELIQRQKVSIIMGANLTNVSFAVSPVINQAKVPFFTFGTGDGLADPVKFPYSFRTNIVTSEEAAAYVKYAIEQMGYKKPALLIDNTALGQSGERAIRAALAPYKIDPVATETFKVTDTDMTSQLNVIRQSGADVIFAWSLGASLASVALSAERIGYNPPVFAGVGMHSRPFIDLAGPKAAARWAGTTFRAFTRSEKEPPSEKTVAFINTMKTRWGGNLNTLLEISALWQDTMGIVVEALKKTKARDGESIRQAIESTTNYPGMMSKFTFSAQQRQGFDPKDLTIAYAVGAVDHIRPRVANLP